MITRRFLSLTALAFGLKGVSAVRAQPYPDRLIKLVVPFPAGGPTDIMGRIAGELARGLSSEATWLTKRNFQSPHTSGLRAIGAQP
jgi:tripartite-type tricarboxylate transporter receptor subunit TctC